MTRNAKMLTRLDYGKHNDIIGRQYSSQNILIYLQVFTIQRVFTYLESTQFLDLVTLD